MTCSQLSREIDKRLGRASPSLTLSAPARQHVTGCDACRRLWHRARQVVRVGAAIVDEDEVSSAAVHRARTRLFGALAQSGRPAVRFDSIRTPVGLVFVSVSDRGVCDVTFDETSAARYLTRLATWAGQGNRGD